MDNNIIVTLKLCDLKPYKDHPFKPYNEKRLDDMADSIRTTGVQHPIIVRKLTRGKYEILSGHNRVLASKVAGLDIIKAIVYEKLNDEEARHIVMVTNILQRSLADLSYSERALVLTEYHDANGQQGKRNDLAFATSPLTAEKLTQEKGWVYDLSADTIERYVRIHKYLSTPLKERLDNGILGLFAAVSHTYLTENEQHLVNETMLTFPRHKLDSIKADTLKELAKGGPLNRAAIESVLCGAQKLSRFTTAHWLKASVMQKFFTIEQKPDYIEEVLERALEEYFAKQPVK